MQFFLSGYIPSVVELLSNGFNYGFPLHYEGPQDSSCAKNLLSAIQNPEAVDAKLDKEIAAHRIAGPYSSPPFPQFRISPLGLVPKKTEGEFRLIHYLSFPQGSSLNDGISSEFTSVSYATVTPFIPSELLATAVLWPKQILRMLFESFLFNLKITTFWGFVGEDFIIMIAVCRWVVQALAKRLKFFLLP